MGSGHANFKNSSFAVDKKTNKGKFTKGQSNGGKVCSHYKENGHTADTCFKKHDFPPHFKKGQGYTINQVSSDDCDSEEQANEEVQQPSNFSLTKD